MTKPFSTKTFEIPGVDGQYGYRVYCKAERTRYGFRHLATLGLTGQKAKICYTNRTWESYEFQSVLCALAEKVGGDTGQAIREFAATYQEKHGFGSISSIAALGDILTDTKAEANDWKLRMIKAGLGEGIQPPPDWDQLSDDEKERRLNKVIQELRQ